MSALSLKRRLGDKGLKVEANKQEKERQKRSCREYERIREREYRARISQSKSTALREKDMLRKRRAHHLEKINNWDERAHHQGDDIAK